MPDQTANTPDKQDDSKGGSANLDQVTIDRAELDALKTKGAKLDNITAKAKSSEFEDAEDYTTALENELQQYYVKDTENEDKEPTDKKKEPDDKKVPPAGVMSDEEKNAMKANDLRSAQAYLESQKTAFQVAQMQLPEDKRSKVTDDELMKVIRDPNLTGMIRSLAGKFGGNIFVAADHYIMVDKGLDTDEKAKARQEGADGQAAMDAAADTANLGHGGKTVDIGDKTADEKAAEENAKLADDIVPDDDPYEFKT